VLAFLVMILRLSLLFTLTLLATGCGTTSDSVEWRVKPQSNYYARDKAEVFDAIEGVLTTMGYEITKRAPASGILEAQSRLLESRVRGAARQYFVTVKLRAVGENETAVEMLVHEAREGEFKVGATKQALGMHGRYDSIFAALESRLGEDSWLPPRGTSPTD
jgi:hypothetical protein